MAVRDTNLLGVPEKMKRPSDHALDLIGRLYGKSNLYERLLGKTGLNLAVLEELVRCDESATIPYIAPVLVSGTRREVVAGAQAIATLLSLTSPEDLVWLDEMMRGYWVFRDGYGERWRRLEPRELAKWVGPGEPGVLLFRLASFHANGFIREAAIRRLALVADGSELPYLLLRLNDWVPQVRQAAQEAVSERVSADYIDHFVQNLALVIRLRKLERTDHRRLLERISDLLASPAARSAMVTTLRHGPTELRRESFHLLTSGDPADLEESLLVALQSEDPVVRLWSLCRAATTFEREQLLTVLDRLCADPSVAVRCEALSLLATEFPDKATERLQAALLDRSASVRGTARFQLRKRGILDFAQFYRDAMETSVAGRLAVSIAGLTETGVPADAERFLPHFLHPSARVRRAVIWGLVKLGGAQYTHLVLGRVLDATPGVSKQATSALQIHAPAVGGIALWTRFAASSLTHVRQNLLRLMAALPKWESIGFLVRAAGEDDEIISSVAREYIRHWNAQYNKSQAIPSTEEIQRLKAALTQWGAILGPMDRALLEFAVSTFLTH